MCSPIWTPDALSSEFCAYARTVWRVVEGQHVISTRRLVDTAEEQALLEAMLEETKPPVPEDCRKLHFLLFTPFRYEPLPTAGSRFRRAKQREGVFYAAEDLSTALAETAFHRLLFFLDSPDTPWPRQAIDMTGFSVRVETQTALDLTLPPFDAQAGTWQHPTDYAPCQVLADAAREAGAEIIRYASVRDAAGGHCVAVLSCNAFAVNEPEDRCSLYMTVDAGGVDFVQDFPRRFWRFDVQDFADDPRLASLRRL